MGALPQVQVTIRDDSVWRAGVLLVTACAIGVLCAWAAESNRAQNGGTTWLALSLVPAAAYLGASLRRAFPLALKFTGSTWLVWRADSARAAPIQGEVQVSLDLGAWMLLRFIPVAGAMGARSQWLPVHSNSLAPQWHALRCALYSARPAAGNNDDSGASAENVG
jgi:hypothetical protein